VIAYTNARWYYQPRGPLPDRGGSPPSQLPILPKQISVSGVLAGISRKVSGREPKPINSAIPASQNSVSKTPSPGQLFTLDKMEHFAESGPSTTGTKSILCCLYGAS
jgi:hypothetical protein